MRICLHHNASRVSSCPRQSWIASHLRRLVGQVSPAEELLRGSTRGTEGLTCRFEARGPRDLCHSPSFISLLLCDAHDSPWSRLNCNGVLSRAGFVHWFALLHAIVVHRFRSEHHGPWIHRDNSRSRAVARPNAGASKNLEMPCERRCGGRFDRSVAWQRRSQTLDPVDGVGSELLASREP